jgi:asparagine synthase (glutamine-hydrolysing)
MCGIAGYIGDKKISKDIICRTLQKMKHRGPDHADYKEFKRSDNRYIYLLHARLSIIDLDKRSHQPFVVGSKSLIFNGEIYNYLELRKNMEDEGINFYTKSDTEVLIHYLCKYGLDAFNYFEGMWAFACYDKSDGTLLLSRDRFGEKPLYIYEDNTGLYFASEPKAVFSLMGKPLPVNYNQIYRYMINGYKSLYKKDETFFEGLKELPSSTYLLINRESKQKTERYWNPRFKPDLSMTFEDAVAGTRERILRSVELRLRSDVPLSFCMSGGIDSNTLICAAKQVFNYDVHGFTVWNEDERYEEREYVENVINEKGIKHTKVYIKPDNFLERIKALICYHDAPVYTISYYVHWLLMKEVHNNGYRVNVSGTGADELFSGYYDHNLWYMAQIYDKNKKLYEKSVLNWEEKIKPYVRNPLLQESDQFIKNPELRDHIFFRAKEFATKYLKKTWFEQFSEEKYTDDKLRNRMLNELFYEAIPVILHEDDLNAMYFSIENRSPFLDSKLFEFAYRVPTPLLIRNGYPKVVLREAMRGIVPDKILENSRKVGFNAPAADFLKVDDVEIKGYLLEDSLIYEHVNIDKIKELIKKEKLPNSESKFLFYFLNAKIFLEENS